MSIVKFIYWEDEGAWLGYVQEYPDYWTQGESLEDLKQHLESLYADLTTGELAGIRKVGELTIS
jgi:predicted RNase H-like HicB family nuclease